MNMGCRCQEKRQLDKERRRREEGGEEMEGGAGERVEVVLGY